MSLPVTTDQQRKWIHGIRAGEMDVFQLVFEHYSPHLQRFAQLWASRDAAEDIVQDVFFDLWQRRLELDPGHARLTSYLFSAVRNQISKLIRHDKIVAKAQNIEPYLTAGTSINNELTDSLAINNDIKGILLRGMSTLSELQRAVLMLRWVHEMSFSEVAATLSISENAAKLHASRGRQALYSVLRPLLEK